MKRFRTLLATLTLGVLVAVAARAEVETRTVNDGNVVLEGVPLIPPEIGERLARYENTRSAALRDWTRDGAGILITTRFGEVSQLHRVDMPGGARHQLTFYDEPIAGVSRRPERAEITFTMDEGGSEFSQIFLLDPATGEASRLTDGASRNGGVEWSDDGGRFAFRSTRRNGRSNDVWMMDPAEPEAATLVVESPDGSSWSPADFSPESDWLLVQQYVSATDSRIHLVDLASGERRQLRGSEEAPSVNLAAAFARDGAGFYFVTDEGSEFWRLAYFALEAGEASILSSDLEWNVSDFTLSEDGARATFTVNEGGIDRLYLLDPSTHAYRRVEGLPTGRIYGTRFSPDATRLGLTLNTARTPSDVFTLELGDDPLVAGPLTRWTFSEVGGLDSDGFVEPQLVHYPTFDQVEGAPRRIPAFVYKPRRPGPHPVVVSIHGGPESQYRPAFSSRYQAWLAELGVAVIAPNVRGSSGYGRTYVGLDNGFRREDSVRDIGALLDWIASQPDLDASRVAVYGGSYGGYMVLASLVHYGDRLRAGVDTVGISNFVTFLENTQDYRRDLRRVEYGDERDPAMRAHLEAISPSHHADRITVPLLVGQGENDPRVPVTESIQIVKEVREAGFDVWYVNALNEGHGFRKKENRDLYEQIVFAFLQRHLGAPSPVAAGDPGR